MKYRVENREYSKGNKIEKTLAKLTEKKKTPTITLIIRGDFSTDLSELKSIRNSMNNSMPMN